MTSSSAPSVIAFRTNAHRLLTKFPSPSENDSFVSLPSHTMLFLSRLPRPGRPTFSGVDWQCPCILAFLALPNINPFQIIVLGPPKLDTQSSTEVWFHVPITGAPTKLSLDCQASGDPEEYKNIFWRFDYADRFRFRWEKNGLPLRVDGERIIWQKPGQSGTIVFLRPTRADQGYYQCFVTNIFGTAVSNRVHVQLGGMELAEDEFRTTLHFFQCSITLLAKNSEKLR